MTSAAVTLTVLPIQPTPANVTLAPGQHFDSVLSDPNHLDFMMPNYMSADPFRPNGMALGLQSGAIPLNAILP